MNIRKVKGDNLKEARNKASLLFDNKFVVLESAESKPGFPASITVAIEESESESYHPDPKRKKPVHLLKPLLSQFEELFEKGGKSINKLMENSGDHGRVTDNVSYNKNKNQTYRAYEPQSAASDGVYFERSSNNYESTPPKKEKKPIETPEKENKTNPYSHLKKRKPYIKENSFHACNHQFEQIQQRLLNLEAYSRLIGKELLPDITGNPVYRHLISKNFNPGLLNHWFRNTPLPGGQPEIQINQIKKILDEELQPKNPDCEKGIYLFSGLPGSDIHSIADLLIKHNMKKSPESCRPVLVAEDSSLLKNFHTEVEIPTYTASDNAEWRQILNREGENSAIFIITKPLSFDLNKVADKWDEYSVQYDSLVKPEHHFVTHGLFEPEQVIHQLPANHHFKPAYISFSNANCCINSPGNFYTYNYYLDTKTGFLFSGTSGHITSDKIIESCLENLNSDDF